jgi:hypothetical protein
MITALPVHRSRGAASQIDGAGLVLVIGGKIYPLIRLALDHAVFQAAEFLPGQLVSLKIAPWNNLTQAVAGKMIIRSSNGVTAHGDFQVTMSLMRFMIQRLGGELGHKPYYFT